MTPVKIEPIETPGTPHYAKLRAEMGGGKLYLGFFLDPLYQVHWNNNAAPLRFEVIAPSGVSATPAKGVAPTVDVPADADPREFLVDIDGRSRESLRVSVSYFACDDAETFCKQVTQEYLVFLERDPDGGSRRSSGRGGRNASRRPGGSSVAQPPQRQMFERMRRLPLFQALDRDGDGELSARDSRRLRGRCENSTATGMASFPARSSALRRFAPGPIDFETIPDPFACLAHVADKRSASALFPSRNCLDPPRRGAPTPRPRNGTLIRNLYLPDSRLHWGRPPWRCPVGPRTKVGLEKTSHCVRKAS